MIHLLFLTKTTYYYLKDIQFKVKRILLKFIESFLIHYFSMPE